MYTKESIKKYIDDLASRKSTPGGGSAAGLCGALGTALLEMVCNFTTGEKYKDIEPHIQGMLLSLKKIREEFSALVDRDVEAYSAIRSAFETKDKKVIDNALKDGYYICLKICELSRKGLEVAAGLPEKGNTNLITDVGCGAELLNAAFNSGVFNCEINLKGIEGRAFVEKERSVLDVLKKEIGPLYKDAISKTKKKMG